MTEQVVITAVPILGSDRLGSASPTGSAGAYLVNFILGVPGAHNVSLRGANVKDLLASGDSLILGGNTLIEKEEASNGERQSMQIEANKYGRLARVKVRIHGASFGDAETEASNLVLPMLSWLAFTTDTALDAVAVILVEESSSVTRIRATFPGQIQPAPVGDLSVSHPEMEKYFSAYREGLSSNSPLYQAVAFHKLIEGIRASDVNRVRRATGDNTYKAGKNGLLTALHLPEKKEDLPYSTPWEIDLFKPFLGKSFEKIWSDTQLTVRSAAVHINPGQDIRVADYVEDVRKCQEVSPVLRHIARILIEKERDAVTPGP